MSKAESIGRRNALIVFLLYEILSLTGAIFFTASPPPYWIAWAHIGITLGVVPIGLFVWLTNKGGVSGEQLGLSLAAGRYSWSSLVRDSVGLFLLQKLLVYALWPFVYILLWRIDALIVPTDPTELRPKAGFMWFGVGLMFSILPGFIEEVFYRGILNVSFGDAIRNSTYRKAFILTSGILFGLGHIDQGFTGVVVMSVMGGCNAYVFIRVKTLWPLITSHVAFNLTYYFF